MLLVRGIFLSALCGDTSQIQVAAQNALLGMFSPRLFPKQVQGGVRLQSSSPEGWGGTLPSAPGDSRAVSLPWGHGKVPPWRQIPGRFCSGVGTWRESCAEKQELLLGWGKLGIAVFLGAVQRDRSWEEGTKCHPSAATETPRKRKWVGWVFGWNWAFFLLQFLVRGCPLVLSHSRSRLLWLPRFPLFI